MMDLNEGMSPIPDQPVDQDDIYLDNNASTRIAPEVLEFMMPLLADEYGNPSSTHGFGARARDVLTTGRERIMAFLGASQRNEIVLTAGGTESDNLAIVGTLRANPDKRHVVTTTVEHPALLGLCQDLEKRQGYEVTYLHVDAEGHLDEAELLESLRDDTAIVSIMAANNETGVLFDVERLGQIVKERGAVFHVDAVQAAGKLPLDMGGSCVDLLSISGHKLHGPKGAGALYVRKGTKLRPLIVGGHQERGRRAGTENTPAAAGLGLACELAGARVEEQNTRVRSLRDHLEKKLLETIPDSKLNGAKDFRLPNTCNISFNHIEGQGILLLLDRVGIAASSGSACTSGSLEPSHVLLAMGRPVTQAHGALRLSLSRDNTMAEVDYVAQVLPKIIERLRQLTPLDEKWATS